MILQTTSRGNSYSVDPIAQSVSAHLRAISPALHASEAASTGRSAPLDLEALYPQIFGASAMARSGFAGRGGRGYHQARLHRPKAAMSAMKRILAVFALALALIGGIEMTTVIAHSPLAAACDTNPC